jgi:hypothetical protein
MSTPLQMTCPLPYAACTARCAEPEKPALRTRLAKLALALAVLWVMFNGERWMLEHSAAGGNELIVATCAADAVFGNSAAENACTSALNARADESTDE